MIKGIGIDVEETERFNKVSEDFLTSIFSKKEIEYCRSKKNPSVSFAGKFCAKESIIKAIQENITMRDIEILNKENGKIVVYITGKIRKDIHCSISHIKNLGLAFCIID